ncbi:eukaryotic initiation factor-like protein, putative [Bodo saltans]|uniref:Eukaryotic initiation factor-like protein, putative n=1 Tax=Bodo saltans TaxID=75058 RepID=A0A0S4KLD6_BODSA|nr:eukaryotic initiation factor-like protein, putative [Bodo saltans]|eukprot:CUI14316.1 eukaryotic initiation factor-like protein, putative [Bodo saltans]
MSRRAKAAEAEAVAETPAAPATAAPAEEGTGRRRKAASATEAAEAAPAAGHVDPTVDQAAAAAPAARTRRVATNVATEGKTTTEAAVSGGSIATDSQAVIDYDSMTYEDFLVQLKQRSKREVVETLKLRSIKESETKKSDLDVEPFIDGTGGYSYHALLDRVYEELRAKNPSLSSTEVSRNQIPVPQIERYGSKKTAVANFKNICDAINRSMEEVKDYLDKELSTTGSIDSSNCLILKLQNVKSIQFEGIIIKYIDEFVKCHSCKKINSTLQKEDRITVLKCNLCQASRTVTAGGNAFHAVTGKRSKLRAANAL